MVRTLSIFLIISILLGNVGMTFGTHYCQGQAVKTEMLLGDESLDCGMMDEQEEKDCDEERPLTIKDDCCENEYNTFKITDEQLSTSVLSLQSPMAKMLIAHFITLFSPVLLSQEKDLDRNTGPAPPLPTGDHLNVLFQVFRL